MTRTPLRGRDSEREVLRDHVHLLVAGTAGVVVVEGAPGSGKSSLVAEVAAHGRERGALVLTATGQAASSGVPLWLLLEALTATDRPPVDVGALPGDNTFRLIQSVHEGLERAALRTPVMIVLDDLQWADPATVNAVRSLTRRLSADPVLWVLASRPVAPEFPGKMLRLEGLEPAAVAQVADDVLGGRPDERLTAMLDGAAHGRPLLLLEFLHGLRDEDAVDVTGGVATLRADRLPLRFGESIRRHVRLLSPAARLAVELASVLGRTFTAEQLARMLDRSPAALLAPLREALEAELIVEAGDRFAFRHDLVREAVDVGLPAPLRQALRRQAIDAGLAEGAPAAEVAALVMETVTFDDRDGIALLRRAAAEIGQRDPATAARLTSRAFVLTRPDDPERGALLTETVTHLVLAGRAPEAADLIDRSGPVLDRVATARIQRLIAEAILPATAGRAAEICREALANEGLPAELRAGLYAVISGAMGIVGRPEEARRAADAAVAESGEGPAVLVAKAVADFQSCDWPGGLRAADDAIRRRNEQTGTRSLSLPDGWKAMMLDAAGRMSEAWRLAEDGARLAQTDGQLANARVWAMVRGRIHLRAGRFDEARAEAEAIQAMSHELGTVSYLYTAAMILAVVAIHRGDQPGMKAADAMAAHMAASDAPSWQGRGQWLQALLAEARGQPADENPAAQMDAVFAGCVRVITLTEHAEVATLVRLLLRAGRRERAEAAVDRLAEEAERHAGEPVVAAALKHARGLLGADPELLLRAVELHEDDERQLLRARVTEDAGTVVAESDRTRGLELLGSALDQWEAAGADRDAARVRGLLRGHGVRRKAPNRPQAGWAGLTESETKVARLVAQGWTNRAIADELYLSPHTVSSHLRHAFVKLGVRSRFELAHRMTGG